MMPKVPFLLAILLLLSLALGAQSTISGSILHQNLERKFILHQPPTFSGEIPTPLLIVLHGGSGNAQSVQGFTNMNQVSNTYGFLALYPEGYAPAQPSGFSWADGRGTSADLAGIDDVGFINTLVDSLVADYNIDTSRIYLCGFSNGGFMTQRIACQANRHFAALASLGSTIDTALIAGCRPQRPIPMLFVMGTDDPFVPYNGGPMQEGVSPVVGIDSLVKFWKMNNGCQRFLPPESLPNTEPSDNSTVTRFTFTDCACDADVVQYRINNGGHTWPGVELPVYELIAGETNEDIQASVELWEFFRVHSRCGTVVEVNEAPAQIPALSLYPNPAEAEVWVGSRERIGRISLYSPSGRLLRSAEPHAGQFRFSLSGLPAGLYLLSARLENGGVLTRRLLKK